MSDPRDDLAKAVALNKKQAGNLLVERQALEAELSRQMAAGDGADALAVTAGKLAAVNQQLEQAKQEIAELHRLARTAGPAAVVASVTGADPPIQSHEDAALEKARGHINDLDALAALGEEATVRAPIPAVTATMSQEEADAEARKLFEEMRARLAGGGKPPKKTM